ncbi:tetratricopeptide repeat protein [Synoicihabitans lomoniglobus]|uniref:Peptidase M50 domain-containing protein n=1 Tax=Synoicihabitans lomoniglobus TaxID=2909285 RepID=A0AAE9ZXQ0_9BACT|nr:hypothetical protein [Opitutaceae bacterium LMO-M01]WED64855.1 hypothetical protein PXH66_21120 [Opitutaceae bacterium LMO-M01]
MSELLILFAIWLWMLLAVSLHEWSHWAVAKIVGLEPTHLNVGQGPVWWRGHLGLTKVTMHWWPFSGLVLARWSSEAGLRWRGTTFALAGPACDAVLFGVLGLIFTQQSANHFMSEVRATLIILMWLQGGMWVTSLLPRMVSSEEYVLGSDGKQAWDFVTGNMPTAQVAGGINYQREVARYDPAFDVTGSWLHEADETIRQDYEVGLGELIADDPASGLAKLKRVLAAGPIGGAERAALLDQMASYVAMHRKMEFLTDAVEWAREAVALQPEAPTLRGTLGGLLIDSGQLDDGMRLLLPLTAESSDQMDRSIAFAYLALAYSRSGDRRRAHDALNASFELNASHGMAERIAQEMRA